MNESLPADQRVTNSELMSMLAWFEGDEKPSPDRITRGHMARALRELQERRDAEQLRGLYQPVLDERGKPTGYYRDLKDGEIVTLDDEGNEVCMVCGGADGEHKPGCEDGSEVL
jgi:hypothetical protein